MYYTLGESIKKIRKDKGLKSKFVAGKLCVHPSTLSKYESNDRKIKADQLPSFADALGVTVDFILYQDIDETEITKSA